jgi:hypothetical protein
MTDTTNPAPTAPDTTSTPTPVYVSEAAFLSLLGEVNQRLTNAEATNAILVAEVDALTAEVAQLRAAA